MRRLLLSRCTAVGASGRAHGPHADAALRRFEQPPDDFDGALFDPACARIERVLLSIADDEALTMAHVAPVERMLALLKEEQATRAAAVRVMFGAVADKSFASLTADSERAVAKTQDMLARDKDLAYARLPRNLTLSFDTFASITRALWPKCSQVEAAAMYRAAFDQSHGRINDLGPKINRHLDGLTHPLEQTN